MKRQSIVLVIIAGLLLGLFAAEAKAAGTRPQAVRVTPNGHQVVKRSRVRAVADFFTSVNITTQTLCGSRVMQPSMPNVGSTGATWTFWWPQIKSNTYFYLTGSGGDPYTGGPLFAQNANTGQQYWQDSAGTWHALSGASTTVSPPLGQRVSYGIDDWLEFVYADGSSSGWLDNGLRTVGYTGPNASGGIGIMYDQYGLPAAGGAFGCIY